MKITGAIFDLDGTLLSSMDYWGTVAGEYLDSLGISTRDDTNRRFLETGMKSWHSWCVENLGLDEPYEVTKSKIYDYMNEKYKTVVALKEGVREMLERLQGGGVKMCLATATDRPTVEMIVKRLDIQKYFSRIFTTSEVGVGKSEPLIYEMALEHLGTNKETTYVFEDAYYALSTAHKNGFKTVGIYDKNVLVPREKILPLCSYFLDENDKYEFTVD